MAKHKKHHNWAALTGKFDFSPDKILFKGDIVKYGEQPGPSIGTVICNEWFDRRLNLSRYTVFKANIDGQAA